MERRAAMRAAGQAAGNIVSETPAHAEQAVEVVQEVPIPALGTSEEEVRVVEGGVPTEEVADATTVSFSNSGDNCQGEGGHPQQQQEQH